MDLSGIRAGFALTGSFCTFSAVLPQIKVLRDAGANVIPIMSENASSFDTRFGLSNDFIKEVEELSGNKVLNSIIDVEPIGPKNLLDIIIVAPCTGNTIGKLSAGITDTAVTMAVKAVLT